MYASGAAGKNDDVLTATHLSMLVVEDDYGDYDAVSRALRRMITLTSDHKRARTIEEARRAMSVQDFDVALIDFHLDGSSGIQVLQEIQKSHINTLPILLTGRTDIGIHEAAISAGAVDCINKDDLSSNLLETTIRYAWHNHRRERKMQNLVSALLAQSNEQVAT